MLTSVGTMLGPCVLKKPRLPAGTVFGWSAALYAGNGQTVPNVITAPADGLAQTAYDATLGSSTALNTDDPTFIAGPPPKFTVDGGDYIMIKATTSFLSDLLRSDQATAWSAAASFLCATPTVSTQNLWGNSQGGAVPGIRINVTNGGNGTLQFLRGNGTTGSLNNLQGNIANKPVLHVFTYNNEVQNFKSALNSRTFDVTATLANLTTTASSPNRMAFGAVQSASGRLPAGSELYSFFMWNRELTSVDLPGIVDYFNKLDGRVYA